MERRLSAAHPSRSPGRAGSPELLDLIRAEIEALGPMTFARFMDLSLNHPTHGYYAQGAKVLGTEGDYFTASDVSRAFGGCLAAQIVEFDARLGHPDPLAVVEFGGGRGLLARDVLDALSTRWSDAARRVRYIVGEASSAMRAAARRTAPEARVESPDRVGAGHVGCAVAVELLDALPVHRVRRRAGRLTEIGVGLDGERRLVEREVDPLPEVLSMAEAYGAAPGEGDVAEVCPAMAIEMGRIADCIERGFLVIVDYGHEAAELYHPSRSRGTLLAYHRHRTSERFLERVGRQDLTAHVNFTALDDAARRVGLTRLGRTTQDRFLIAQGILAPFEEREPERWREPARVRERLRVMQLIHPSGMGRAFHVSVFGKGVVPIPHLSGLEDPFARP
jgi:SAM-dependent MidA family methyltransferase